MERLKKIIQKRKNPDDPIRFLVPYEQIFDTMYRIHIQVGHKCRDIMLDECNKSHLNITVDMITYTFVRFLLELSIVNNSRQKFIILKIFMN